MAYSIQTNPSMPISKQYSHEELPDIKRLGRVLNLKIIYRLLFILKYTTLFF